MQFKPIWKVEPRFFGVDDCRAIIPQHYVIVYADTGELAGMYPERFSTREKAQALVDECHAEARTAPIYR